MSFGWIDEFEDDSEYILVIRKWRLAILHTRREIDIFYLLVLSTVVVVKRLVVSQVPMPFTSGNDILVF